MFYTILILILFTIKSYIHCIFPSCVISKNTQDIPSDYLPLSVTELSKKK